MTVLGVVARPGTTEPVRALVTGLARHVTIRAVDGAAGPGRAGDEAAAAVLATEPRSLARVPPGVPAAVWVGGDDDRPAPGAAAVVLVPRDALRDPGDPAAGSTVAVPAHGLDLTDLVPVPPVVRARWRARPGRPTPVVITVSGEQPPDGDLLAELTSAAAAVVTGGGLTTALALGTPVVTSPADAARIGARAGQEVVVGATPAERRTAADRLAADERLAASLSWRGRALVERRFDLGPAVRATLVGLGLVPPATAPAARLEQRLRELATPPGSPIRARAWSATALFDDDPARPPAGAPEVGCAVADADLRPGGGARRDAGNGVPPRLKAAVRSLGAPVLARLRREVAADVDPQLAALRREVDSLAEQLRVRSAVLEAEIALLRAERLPPDR